MTGRATYIKFRFCEERPQLALPHKKSSDPNKERKKILQHEICYFDMWQ